MNQITKPILIIIAIIIVVIGAALGLNYFENYQEFFYVQIDNNKISKTHGSSDMPYEYELTSYDENGKSRTFTFKTPRELRNQAYLKLLIKATGVNRWEEVQLDEIPTPARDQLSH